MPKSTKKKPPTCTLCVMNSEFYLIFVSLLSRLLRYVCQPNGTHTHTHKWAKNNRKEIDTLLLYESSLSHWVPFRSMCVLLCRLQFIILMLSNFLTSTDLLLLLLVLLYFSSMNAVCRLSPTVRMSKCL